MAKKMRKVLYAEDDRGLRSAVSAKLRNLGYEVLEVATPKLAMQALECEEFDIILLDLVMPEYDVEGGQKVLEFMRGEEDGKKITTPVLLLTAFGYNGPAEEAKKAYEEVVKRVLTKSFDPQDVADSIADVLRERRREKPKPSM